MVRFVFALIAGLAATAAHAETKPAAKPPAKPAQTQKPAPPRPADPAREAAAKVAGEFRLSSADGERTCAFTLKPDAAGTAFAVVFDRPACAPIAFTAQVTSWTTDDAGAIRLLNSQGRGVAEFTEGTGGSYEALREGDGVYFLSPPTAVETVEVKMEEMVGEWDIARAAGTPVCHWTLTDQPTPKGGFTLKVASGCDAGLLQFAPVSWSVEGGNVVVTSGSGAPALRFARQEDGGWSRVPERGRPLLMSRP